MRLNKKDAVELEPLKKIIEIRTFSNKELRLRKASMWTLLKPSEYCEPITKKPYHYVSGIVGMVYHPFINEDIRDCYVDHEQEILVVKHFDDPKHCQSTR